MNMNLIMTNIKTLSVITVSTIMMILKSSIFLFSYANNNCFINKTEQKDLSSSLLGPFNNHGYNLIFDKFIILYITFLNRKIHYVFSV